MTPTALAVMLLLFAPTSAASARTLPQTATGRGDTAVRPPRIIPSGVGSFILGGRPRGSGIASLGRLTWTAYNTKAARASGIAWRDDCVPDCAEGTYHPTPMHLRLFRP